MPYPILFNKTKVLAQFDRPATLKEAQVSSYLVKRAVAEGLLEVSGKVETGKRGRPQMLFVVTTKGRSLIPN